MKAITKNSSRVWILTAVLTLSNIIFAANYGIIKGRVVNKKNQPIELATATLTNTKTLKTTDGAMCDQEGNFSIEDVDPGEYTLSVSMVGYKKCETVKVTVEANYALIIGKPFMLNDSIHQLRGLVVKAKRQPAQNSTENGLLTANATNSNLACFLNIGSYISEGYNCMLNTGIQLYDFTSKVKSINNFSKYLLFNSR
jgi:hypothetical protein